MITDLHPLSLCDIRLSVGLFSPRCVNGMEVTGESNWPTVDNVPSILPFYMNGVEVPSTSDFYLMIFRHANIKKSVRRWP